MQASSGRLAAPGSLPMPLIAGRGAQFAPARLVNTMWPTVGIARPADVIMAISVGITATERATRDFLLSDGDRAFRAQVHEFLGRELRPRASAIENDGDWGALRDALCAVGQAGYLKLMFAEL